MCGESWDFYFVNWIIRFFRDINENKVKIKWSREEKKVRQNGQIKLYIVRRYLVCEIGFLYIMTIEIKIKIEFITVVCVLN